MQSFIVDYNLSKNFQYLDSKRLFKNLLENFQILNACLDKDYGWQNHPAVRQIRGYEQLLMNYIEANYKECLNRNIAIYTTLWQQTIQLAQKFNIKHNNNPNKPNWWGNEQITNSHKNRLFCKGEIDIVCAAIKKHLKIKSIDAWLKERYKKSKNQLKWADCLVLKEFCAANNIDITEKNHYSQFGWDVNPAEKYIWPV